MEQKIGMDHVAGLFAGPVGGLTAGMLGCAQEGRPSGDVFVHLPCFEQCKQKIQKK